MSVREYPAVMLHKKLHSDEGFFITRVEQEAGMSHPIWIGEDYKTGVYPLCIPVQPETLVRPFDAGAEPVADVGWADPWPVADAEHHGWMTVVALTNGVRYAINPTEGYQLDFEYCTLSRPVLKDYYIFLAEDGFIDGKPRPKETLVKVASNTVEVEGKCVIFKPVRIQDDAKPE